jgi:hypothetical protein
MIEDRIIYERKVSKLIDHGKRRIFAKFLLHAQVLYFSITGEIRNLAYPDGIESYGCLHDEIAEAFPELRRFIPLHLSDEKGEPMHAVENGWYWAGGQLENFRRPGTNPPNVSILADQLRISEDVAYWLVFFASRHSPFRKLTDEEISKFPKNVPGKLPYLLILPYGGRMRKVDFESFVNAQRDRWKAEAAEAIAFLKEGQ